MATTATTLVQRSRRYLGDFPEYDSCTASFNSSGTTVAVADSSIYTVNWTIQLDNEAMLVRAKPSGTTLTVLRAARGSAGASHANSTTILVNPRFTDMEYLDALNAGISATFPFIYQPVVDESISVVNTATYEYTIPTLNGAPIPFLSKLQFLENGDLAYRDFQAWTVLRGSTPKIKLRRPLPQGTLRIYGFGPIPQLTGFSDSLSALYPAYAEDALTMFAAQYLLGAGEAARVRQDTGARDDRENANRAGTSMSAANAIYTRFLARLNAAALPPMPKHLVSTL